MIDWLDPAAGAEPTAALGALFLASFLAATLLPGGSELALLAVLHRFPDSVAPALALATLGNTLGGMSSWACGRWLPRWQRLDALPQQARVARWGAPALLFSWVPLIGDALCVAAGWLRIPWLPAALCMALGKFARYALLAFSVSG